jgi:hypothetical protein
MIAIKMPLRGKVHYVFAVPKTDALHVASHAHSCNRSEVQEATYATSATSQPARWKAGTPTEANDEESALGAAGTPGGPAQLNSESESYPEGYLDDPQAFREKVLAAEAEASMHQTDAGINNEELLAQDIQPEEVAATEEILVGAPAMAEEFADWMVEEVFNDSSSEDIHEGGYDEPRLSPTRKPSTGWPENTPQSIRLADAAVTDPDLKQHSGSVNEMLEVVLQQKFFCT